jgi:hypothetical protein
MNEPWCPPDEQLLALLDDERVPPEVSRHLEYCPSCQQRLVQVRSELNRLRQGMRAADAKTLQ